MFFLNIFPFIFLTPKNLRLKLQYSIFTSIERIITLSNNISRNTLDRTLLLDILNQPFINTLINLISTKKSNNFLRRMLITIYLPCIYLHTQIHKITLILLMNRLVTLRIRPLNYLCYLLILHNPAIHIQQHSLVLYCVQLCDHPFHLNLIQHLLPQISKFVKRQLCYQLEDFHLSIHHTQIPYVQRKFFTPLSPHLELYITVMQSKMTHQTNHLPLLLTRIQ